MLSEAEWESFCQDIANCDSSSIDAGCRCFNQGDKHGMRYEFYGYQSVAAMKLKQCSCPQGVAMSTQTKSEAETAETVETSSEETVESTTGETMETKTSEITEIVPTPFDDSKWAEYCGKLAELKQKCENDAEAWPD